MPFRKPHLLIGVSARIYYPAGPVLDLGGVWTKTLHYLEQSVAHWLPLFFAVHFVHAGQYLCPVLAFGSTGTAVYLQHRWQFIFGLIEGAFKFCFLNGFHCFAKS